MTVKAGQTVSSKDKMWKVLVLEVKENFVVFRAVEIQGEPIPESGFDVIGEDVEN